jgi:surface protein
MSLSRYIHDSLITERLKITPDTQPLRLRPKTKDELRSIIEQELKEQGPNADLNFIDTSEITDMVSLFYKLNIGNIKIDQWNTSNVTTMQNMFVGQDNFRGDGVENWNTSNVTNMSFMFYECKKFEGKGIENWNVSKVENMEDMFSWCKKLNVDLSSWNVTNVKNMSYMFYFCERFNCDLSEWDVSKVIKYYMTFDKCPNMGTNPQLQPKFKD